jgi:hypothetical protein
MGVRRALACNAPAPPNPHPRPSPRGGEQKQPSPVSPACAGAGKHGATREVMAIMGALAAMSAFGVMPGRGE